MNIHLPKEWRDELETKENQQILANFEKLAKIYINGHERAIFYLKENFLKLEIYKELKRVSNLIDSDEINDKVEAHDLFQAFCDRVEESLKNLE